MAEITTSDIAHVMQQTAGPDRDAAWAAIDAIVARLYDRNLFTALNHLAATAEVERLYSSNTTAYPVGGRKQKKDTHWGKKTIDEGELYICHNAADIERTFFDHALIFSLGVAGMVNVPVMLGGKCIASLSISAPTDRFSEADRPELMMIAGLTLPLILSAP
jgi:hypothetical protein